MQFMENISFLFIIELKLEMNYNYKNSSIRLTIYIVIFELEYARHILFFVLGKKIIGIQELISYPISKPLVSLNPRTLFGK